MGHVCRMEDGRILKDILYGKLASGRRSKGRPQLRYKDVCKRDMKALDINTESWEDLAADRMMWRSTLNQHLKTEEEKLVKAEVRKRACRKERNNPNRPETTQMRLLRQRLFLPHRSLQPQATLRQSNRQDNRVKSFSVFGPTVWNSLPLSLRKSQCFTTFKAKLKTHLFRAHLC